MTINQLIIRNLKKNIQNYYLYVFALIFSVALYFAFVTLQFDPALDEAKGSIKGAAGLRAASVLLVAIVTIFLLYANNIFIKRRSKEIGLYQLIGMTKSKIFHILTAENLLIYYGSLFIGIIIGFSFSRLILLILLKISGVKTSASLHFSLAALIQTVVVFSFIFLLIMLTNQLFLKKQSILALFRVVSSTEGKAKNLSLFEIVVGALGISFIIIGYYVSSKLFDGAFRTMNELSLAMVFILASVIIGTYLFYKGSVSLLANIIRKKKNGYLTINEVLSLSTIMFRMKSNALLLTIITTVSALAIGLLSLSYISFYSAEKAAQNNVPHHFTLTQLEEGQEFKEALAANHIEYTETKIEVIQVKTNIAEILESNLDGLNFDPKAISLPVISEKAISGCNLSREQTVLRGYHDTMQTFLPFKDSGELVLSSQHKVIKQNFLGLQKDFIISWYFTNGGLPCVIVDEEVFTQLKNDLEQDLQKESSLYIGIDLKDVEKLKQANNIFQKMTFTGNHDSQLEKSSNQKQLMGLVMFIVGFLGLSFLITSGCILYFKQMDESEDEKPNYTILRKLGFTQRDLLKGIQAKQLFNFGIPLVIGLSHSYFAVQSGWFFFGTELWTPMLVVMGLYAVLYSIFAILSILYYKKVIKEAL